MPNYQTPHTGDLKEFMIDIDMQHTFLMEINNKDDGDIFLFCKPVNDRTKYFFMGRNKEGNWIILSRFTVPSYILELENLISEKVLQAMATRISL